MSVASTIIGSSGVLGFILGGGLLTALVGGYRFVVNYRLSERGMARDRVADAIRDQRAERGARQRAEREAALWQGRCGDLEYALRRAGQPVPAISPELHVLAFSSLNPEAADSSPPRRRHSEREREDPLNGLEDRLRRQEQDDESRQARSGGRD